ncbi:MAG: hypothetical protein JNM66_14460 [Bryobacterales bacterium]|nr:hypothetical protein [Bryobacterales bacterium]
MKRLTVLIPDTLPSLWREVYPVYRVEALRLYEALRTPVKHPYLMRVLPGDSALRRPPIYTAIQDWVLHRNLGELWVLEIVRDTLAAWAGEDIPVPGSGTIPEYLRFDLRSQLPVAPRRLPDEGLPFSLTDPGIEQRNSYGQVEPWLDFEKRLRGAFEKELAAYKQRFHAIAVEPVTAPSMGEYAAWTEPRAQRTERHFDWLIRFQVGGEDFGGIAGPLSKSRGGQPGKRTLHPDSVRDAVRTTAAAIGLDLRPPRKGRPPKAQKK